MWCFSTSFFVIAFSALFTWRGVEGPRSSRDKTYYAFALGIAILLAVTLSPVLSSFLLRADMKETANPLWEGFRHFYHSLFVRVLAWPRTALVVIVALIVAVLSMFLCWRASLTQARRRKHLGSRDLPLTISLDHGAQLLQPDARDFDELPEVTNVGGRSLGRPDDGTETTGFFTSSSPSI